MAREAGGQRESVGWVGPLPSPRALKGYTGLFGTLWMLSWCHQFLPEFDTSLGEELRSVI